MSMIGLIGVGGAGKHLVAGILAALLNDRGDTVLLDGLAKPIKMAIRASEGDIDKVRDRRPMQHMGAALRDQDPKYLVRCLVDRNGLNPAARRWAGSASTAPDWIIIPDVRDQIEFDFCRENGVMILVEGSHRSLEGKEAAHPSEAFARTVTRADVDFHIPRRRNITETFRAVEDLVAGGHYQKREA